MGMDEKGEPYEVLIVGVGREYPVPLGLRREERLPP